MSVVPFSTSYIVEEGDRTVALVISGGEESRVYCTGVWVGSNVILTAGHCIEGVLGFINSSRVEPVGAFGLGVQYIIKSEVSEVGRVPTGVHMGTCIGLDLEHDLALIRAEGLGIPKHGYVELASRGVVVGDHVSVTGHPTGLYWSYVEGIVSAYRLEMPVGEGRLGPYVQVSMPIWYGNSGGGLFDRDGHLVGITSFISASPNTAFFIDLVSIRDFLRTYRVLP